jgi:prepilin-type N-terminal cleavage/methylation domain-containing protein
MIEKTKKQEGFTYIEVMIAIVILTVGIMAQLSALSLTMFRATEAEKRNTARQIGSSTIESIFAARDLGNVNGISNWEAVNLTTAHADGIFTPGWNLIRESAGQDGVLGTPDDSCGYNYNCQVGTYTNTSEITSGFERKIEVIDVTETGVSDVKKRRIEVKIRYYVGQISREETLSTLIADLPFYK